VALETGLRPSGVLTRTTMAQAEARTEQSFDAANENTPAIERLVWRA